MKTNILRSNSSFRMLLLFLTTLAFLVLQGLSITSASAADVPYNQHEVQKIKAFLECPSMVVGKTNADLLGANINDPGTWATWCDYVPGNPEVKLPTKHVLLMGWSGASLAGSVDISGFKYMQVFLLDCLGGTASTRSNFDNINVCDNDSMKGFFIRYVSAGAINISNNPSLGNVQIKASDVRTLSLNQPNLTGLTTSTLGDVPINLSQYPLMQTLDLAEIDNITELDLTGLPQLIGFSLSYMGGLKTIKMGSKLYLEGVVLFNNPVLTKLDLTVAPNMRRIECDRNGQLALIDIGSGRPNLDRITVKGNPSLQSLELTNLPALEYLTCDENIALEKLVLNKNPKLKQISCESNALTSLDVSGLPALIYSLRAANNQLTEFNGSGVSFRNLSLEGNKLKEVSANLRGHNVHLKAYREGGYVDFMAVSGTYLENDPIVILLNYRGLPAPYNTKFDYKEGSGLPSGNGWKSSFTLNSDIDVTFYFYVDVHLLNYFEKPEDNPGYEYGQGVNLDVNFTVGDSIVFPEGFPAPSKTGYELYGWYTDSIFTHEWIFGKDLLRGELTLYPNWLPKGIPVVLSVKRQSPSDENTSTDQVTYLVTFNKTVSGVDVSDFKLTTEGTVTGKIVSVSAPNGNTISVEVNTITGTGTLRLDVKNTGTGIVDAENNPLAGGYTTGQIYRIIPSTGFSDSEMFSNNCMIYPNPTSGTVQIFAPDNQPFDRIEVFNIQGKKVLFINKPMGGDVDLSGFPKGFYFIKIHCKSRFYNQRLVKY